MRLLISSIAFLFCLSFAFFSYIKESEAGVFQKPAGLAAVSEALAIVDPADVVRLPVPYYRQEYVNSCEAASTRMALAYYGIQATDIDIAFQFGYKPRIKDVTNNIWDDPQEMFVGFINVPAFGYGVYGKPVAKAVQAYGRTAVYETIITPQFLAEQIKAGYPVIIWGNTSNREPAYSWKTDSGKDVKAFKGEHARLIVGVKGPTTNPAGFYLHDPINGEAYKFWKTSDLISNIYSVHGVTNQAVVVK